MLPFVSQSVRGPSRRALGIVVILALALVALPTLQTVAAAPFEEDAATDQRLQELEKKLQALRDEIAALRRKREANNDKVMKRGLQVLARSDICTRCHVPPVPAVGLFRAVGDGRFETMGSGTAVEVEVSDGWLDLFVTDPHGCPGARPCRVPEKVPVTSGIPLLARLFETREKEKAAEVKLSRKSYPLPKTKAEAFAAFLREHVKAPVIEPKVEGDALIVTTTPEVQKAVGQLVSLIHKESAEKGP